MNQCPQFAAFGMSDDLSDHNDVVDLGVNEGSLDWQSSLLVLSNESSSIPDKATEWPSSPLDQSDSVTGSASLDQLGSQFDGAPDGLRIPGSIHPVVGGNTGASIDLESLNLASSDLGANIGGISQSGHLVWNLYSGDAGLPSGEPPLSQGEIHDIALPLAFSLEPNIVAQEAHIWATMSNIGEFLSLAFEDTFGLSATQHRMFTDSMNLHSERTENAGVWQHVAGSINIELHVLKQMMAAKRMTQHLLNRLANFDKKKSLPEATRPKNVAQPPHVLGQTLSHPGLESRDGSSVNDEGKNVSMELKEETHSHEYQSTKHPRDYSPIASLRPTKRSKDKGGIIVPGLRCTHPHCRHQRLESPTLKRGMRHESECCFPKSTYLCSGPGCKKWFKKEEKVINHIKSQHPGDDLEALLGAIQSRENLTQFHTVCRFVEQKEACTYHPTSREESLEHTERHWYMIAIREWKEDRDWSLQDDACQPQHTHFNGSYEDYNTLSQRSLDGPDDEEHTDNSRIGKHHNSRNESHSRPGNSRGGNRHTDNGESSGTRDISTSYGHHQAYSCRGIQRNTQNGVKEISKLHSVKHLRRLGQGGFAIVDEIELGTPAQAFAMKTLPGSKEEPRHQSFFIHFQNEVRALSRLKHPNIIRLVSFCQAPLHLNIVLSPVAECSLTALLQEKQRIVKDLFLVMKWMRTLASALTYMHSIEVQVRHRDIKPDNILVKDNEVFFSDFGSAISIGLPGISDPFSPVIADATSSCNPRKNSGLGTEKQQNRRYQFASTPKYCAPEVIDTGFSGRASDVFSLGCVYLELLTVLYGENLDDFELSCERRNQEKIRPPFRACLNCTLRWVDRLKSVTTKQQASYASHYLFDVVVMMLQKAPVKRPSAQAVEDALSAPPLGFDFAKLTGPSFKEFSFDLRSPVLNCLPAKLVSFDAITLPQADSTVLSSGNNIDENGLRVFVNPTSPSSDIIVVHGLSDTSIGRLSCISSALPTVRVLSYCYAFENDQERSGSDGEFPQVHVLKLIRDLETLRGSCPLRPFMFLGHGSGASVVTEVVLKLQAEPKAAILLVVMPGILFVGDEYTEFADRSKIEEMPDLGSRLKQGLGSAIKELRRYPSSGVPGTTIFEESAFKVPDDELKTGRNRFHFRHSQGKISRSGILPKEYRKSIYEHHRSEETSSLWENLVAKFVRSRVDLRKPMSGSRLARHSKSNPKGSQLRSRKYGYSRPDISVWTIHTPKESKTDTWNSVSDLHILKDENVLTGRTDKQSSFGDFLVDGSSELIEGGV